MKIKLLLSVMLLALLTTALSLVSRPAFSQDAPQAGIATLTLNPSQIRAQAGDTLEAPFAFNAIVPAWVFVGEAPEILLRTSADGQNWSEWRHIHAHNDWTLPEANKSVGDMILVPAADNTHRFIQFQVHMDADATQLSALSFTFIDSTDGPTTAEMLAQQEALDAQQPPAITDSYPRPAVISRAIWCIYDTCDDTEDLVYEPATHLIVHHTVSSNDNTNWASAVRAIYLYHRDTQEWGDIGYNYLIDRSGVIYEGHMNEDYQNLDVVGIHAGAANTGSMGAALLGTFTSAEDEYDLGGGFIIATPPAAMLQALANLFAWKADQRGIDVYDAGRLPNTGWGLPHIMGHRDVYGGMNTICPGGSMQDLLPWLRTQIVNRLGQVSPYTFVSEESAAFTKTNAPWFETEHGCGWQGHAYYTWSTTNPAQSTNWGEWRLNAPSAGLYEIQVYAPYCDTNNSETAGATYTINNGVTSKTAVVSHQENVGLWMSLGVYQLSAGNNTLRLTDLTPTDSGVGVWFDDVRFKPATSVEISHLSPANNAWATQPTVPFNWQIDFPSLVQSTKLEVAADEAFTDIVTTQNWQTAVTSATHPFNQDYQNLYWRVSADIGGVTSHSTPTRFGLDSTPPASTITGLTLHAYTGRFDAIWAGSDAGSGIAGYDIDYKTEGDAAWTRWLTNTAQSSAAITLTNAADLIWFRSQAHDNAGNVEAAGGGDMRSDQAVVLFNPGAQNSSPAASWTNNPALAFTWALTEISTVNNSTLEVARDPAFSQIIAMEQTNNGSSQHELTLAADDGDLYWRVTVAFTPPLPGLTSTVTSAPTWFGLDATPPTSTVTAVYTLTQNAYLITTAGSDAHAGISHIGYDYQVEGDDTWTLWTGGAVFTPPETGQTYFFRSQAIDGAGNLEPAHPTADISTQQAIPIPHAIMLPVITK